MNTSTFSQKGLFACTFFLPISLFETVSDIWFLRFSEQVFFFIHAAAVVVALLLSCIRLFVTPGTIARQASLSSTVSQNLLTLMSIELVMPSNRLILCCPLLLLPSVFPSIRVFSKESALCIRWPKYWSFSISSSSEYSELISFRIDWFDLLADKGTLKSPLTSQFESISSNITV